MKRIALALCCSALLLSQTLSILGQNKPAPATQAPPAPLTLNHGGKIEMKYDGFSFETVVTLKKMNVNCGAAKGFKDLLKDTCVSLAASLHCPGRQLDFVRRARLQLTFQAEDWHARHPPEARDLVVVADGETLRLGRMSLVSQGVDGGLLDDKMKEVLEVSFPYQTFVKIARAQTVEMRVGNSAFALREKNVAALRDLNNMVKP